MTCVSQDTLQTFLDNELETSENSRVSEHLRGCATCSRELANTVRLKRATHQAGQRFTPSAAFQRKMMAQFSVTKVPQPNWWRRAMLLAPSALGILLLVVSLGFYQRERSVAFCRELTDLHISTLASATPVDVVSSDRHTVKPWFAGRLPFTFNLPELQGSQYDLIGGRMAFLGQSPAAQLIFKYREHKVSVFIVQEDAVGNRGVHPPANFTLTTWHANGLAYFLVTDASPDTMSDLIARMKNAGRA
jgi:anti-sigma factor RsiW